MPLKRLKRAFAPPVTTAQIIYRWQLWTMFWFLLGVAVGKLA